MSEIVLPRVIVVGGGLAGASACHAALECGVPVLLLDKSAFCGGNSVKATSGINGAGTRFQESKGIKDTLEVFYNDTLRGAVKRKENGFEVSAVSENSQTQDAPIDFGADPRLSKVLTYQSSSAIHWLADRFSIDLTRVLRLGGHSYPRTHQGESRFPGMTITDALIKKFEKLQADGLKLGDELRYDDSVDEPSKREPSDGPLMAEVRRKAKVTKLLKDSKGSVIGVEYEDLSKKKLFTEYGSVILATGGYGADYETDSLLKEHRPDIAHMPTTNGRHCTGDGIKLAVSLGAGTVNMNAVQVHPTGLVDPKDPEAPVKFLAAEALRGAGGIILDSKGNRFINELGRRDDVTGAMWSRKSAPYYLILNSAACSKLPWHIGHYCSRGLMKQYESLREWSTDVSVPLENVERDLKELNLAWEKEQENPGKGGYLGYPGKATFDKIGRVFYEAMPWSLDDKIAVAIITPVVHYTMGGLQVSTLAEICSNDSKPIKNLYGAGEINGGIHGENRLGGSSLLDCVVFGRIAGEQAAKAVISSAVSNVSTLVSKM